MRRPGGLLALMILCAACAGTTGGQPAPEAGRPPNVVLIISDDHGWNDYAFMGDTVIRTPNLDRLAAQSMVYTRGYVPTALCRPSLASMATGLYPHQHGITGNDPPGGRSTMRDPLARKAMVDIFQRNETLPELLGTAGYVSFQTGKWWEGSPTEHGFTEGMTHGDVSRGGRHGDEGLSIGREGMQPIFDFIQASGGRPFFLWYAPFLPHTPHTPPDRLLARYDAPGRTAEVARYLAMIEWLDESVGELMDYLDRSGLRESTLVFYVADNGWIQDPRGVSGVAARSKLSSYEAGTRTPIVVRWPGRVAPGRDERTLVSTLDLAPTVLRAAGLRPRPELPGIDLLDRDGLARRSMLFGELFAHTAVEVDDPVANLVDRSVVREDGWKLILPYAPNRDVAITIEGTLPGWKRFRPELFNVIADPFEQNDQAAHRPELVAELRSDIERWWPVPDSAFSDLLEPRAGPSPVVP